MGKKPYLQRTKGMDFRYYATKERTESDMLKCGKKKINKIEFYIQQNYLTEVKTLGQT